MSSHPRLPAGAAANTNSEEDRQYLFFLLLTGNFSQQLEMLTQSTISVVSISALASRVLKSNYGNKQWSPLQCSQLTSSS